VPKGPLHQDKISLLMEETGCDQKQAELAMTSVGYNLEKAIRTIGTLLKNIVVVRVKFHVPSQHLYGLVILLADVRRRSLFRIRAVVSYNPALYETPLAGDWYDFEKTIYAFRLHDGTLQQVTQNLEKTLQEWFEKNSQEGLYDVLTVERIEGLREIFQKSLFGYFTDNALEMQLSSDELNLEQFRRFKLEEETVPSRPEGGPDDHSGSKLVLNIDLQQDADGIPAREVKAGDFVYALLTDGRDIAQYLSKLLGGSGEHGLKPLPAPVESSRRDGETISFQIRLSGTIVGVAEVGADSLVRLQKRTAMSWWRRLVPFWE